MRKEIFTCTLGDLIVALTDQASRISRSRQELYNVVADKLVDLVRNKRLYFKSDVYQLVRATSDQTRSRRSH